MLKIAKSLLQVFNLKENKSKKKIGFFFVFSTFCNNFNTNLIET